MKGKYITTQIRLVCAAKPKVKKDIHEEIEETIAERKKIILQLTQAARVINMYLDNPKAA
jgi:hypothetical protein